MTKTADELGARGDQQPSQPMTDILSLEQLEVDIFSGRSLDEDLQRVFGVRSPAKLSSQPD